jgi:tRNA-2-methylthio-N6-dimethylallyladenosine synthase
VAAIRAAIPGISITTDVIVGFCGESDAAFEATLRLLETVRYDQVFAAAYSERPGTPAARLPDDVPPATKRRRLNELLAVQERIGLERNLGWVGSRVEVLVDTLTPPRTHDHDGETVVPTTAGMVAASGRSRQNKLVHLEAPESLVGSIVQVTVEAAGPYSLRGRLA